MTEHRKSIGDHLTGDDPLAVIWPEVVRIVFRDSPREAHPERLTPAARTYYFVGCFNGELVNGGMSQFFSNSAGNHSRETLAALKEIGATLSASLLERALTIFPNSEAPVDRKLRCELLFAFEKRDPKFLEDLTDVYYKRVDALGSVPEEDMIQLCEDYLRKHQADPVAG
jgi:hypothetical protein